MQNRGISQAVIRRLPRYYRYLGELIEQGVERISSNELSKRMKVTASQIRHTPGWRPPAPPRSSPPCLAAQTLAAAGRPEL